MERLVGSFLRDEMLASVPLHPNQHADQAGKFMETALHRLVVQVEKALDQQETALGVFLDKEGHLITPHMTPCVLLFLNMGLITPSYGEIRATLEDHLAAATLGGLSKRIMVSRGCPQGGVLSPLLWCLVVDDLIARLNGGGIYTQGYADDICLPVVGIFLNTVLGLIQWALHTVETWCDKVGMSVNTEKNQAHCIHKER